MAWEDVWAGNGGCIPTRLARTATATYVKSDRMFRSPVKKIKEKNIVPEKIWLSDGL